MAKETEKKIINYLEKCDWPSTTEMVAKTIRVSWNTAQVVLLKLVNQDKIKYKKGGRQNQFWLNKRYNKNFKK